MNINLNKALKNPFWVNHKKENIYFMDGKKDQWVIIYYPIFQDGKTQEFYNEPRALVENTNRKGFWSKEVPLRYLKQIKNNNGKVRALELMLEKEIIRVDTKESIDRTKKLIEKYKTLKR